MDTILSLVSILCFIVILFLLVIGLIAAPWPVLLGLLVLSLLTIRWLLHQNQVKALPQSEDALHFIDTPVASLHPTSFASANAPTLIYRGAKYHPSRSQPS